MGFQRARTETQIQKRTEEITAAAAKLFDEGGHEAVSFTAISELTKFTRPTIYKYFDTKEAILLAILADEFREWAEDLLQQFKLDQHYTALEISIIWSETLAKHQRLNSLQSVLYTVLERNVSLDVMVNFKKQLFTNVMPAYRLLSALFPNVSEYDLQHFMMQQYAITIGTYSMSQLTPLQEAAMKQLYPDYQGLDFAAEYQQIIYPLLLALEGK
ncbi:MAG: hypothetical protein PWP51_2344 [Clostridiales bacterium]|jgi:AcrR family transcriptional regulator|nr:hypothetical protein [Clostridiales bacterium]MDN5299791.1 hypothetical protein [Clostridiales bacterium]